METEIQTILQGFASIIEGQQKQIESLKEKVGEVGAKEGEVKRQKEKTLSKLDAFLERERERALPK